jgi:phosphomevalonate kinase
VTTSCSASAPGKVVLSGEYAVLDGAPAICMAVNRRACATLRDIDASESRVSAPGFSDDIAHFRTTDDGVQWLPEPTKFELIDAVWRATDDQLSSAMAIDLNTDSFVDHASGEKLGVGSSAAITVAFSAAVKRSTDVAAIARRAHIHLQSGRGSGVDVACSLSGGLIKYRMEGARVTSLNWPKGLECRIIWTGVATSTSAKLAQLDATVSKPTRTRLMLAAENIAAAWCDGNADAIIAEYRNYIPHLRAFGNDHKLGIFDAGHEQLCQAASDLGLVYKPCGAGGGDIGIVLGTNSTSLNEFVDALVPPCMLVDCALDKAGIRIEEQNRFEENNQQ